jgi:type II secretory pathway pseudopilin PulG
MNYTPSVNSSEKQLGYLSRAGRRTVEGSMRSRADAFTLVEIMVAAVVLVLAIVSSITALQVGLRAIDNARNYTAAAQLMQNEMEGLRLKSWSQLEALKQAGITSVAVPPELKSGGAAFTCSREITDLKTDMKQLAVVASWRGYDGRPHTTKLVTRYAKTGLYDYFYTSH